MNFPERQRTAIDGTDSVARFQLHRVVFATAPVAELINTLDATGHHYSRRFNLKKRLVYRSVEEPAQFAATEPLGQIQATVRPRQFPRALRSPANFTRQATDVVSDGRSCCVPHGPDGSQCIVGQMNHDHFNNPAPNGRLAQLRLKQTFMFNPSLL
ncbi:hypothetical protein [Paraburkholderia sp. J7]|uniref:hypothetical protein n=1 Tax=Paraburkholderia sp. J7 TaxID=2805438 RepID=UPI002AB7CC47|nr:hypothetical protein [Paraburkholderia sp. J7]